MRCQIETNSCPCIFHVRVSCCIPSAGISDFIGCINQMQLFKILKIMGNCRKAELQPHNNVLFRDSLLLPYIMIYQLTLFQNFNLSMFKNIQFNTTILHTKSQLLFLWRKQLLRQKHHIVRKSQQYNIAGIFLAYMEFSLLAFYSGYSQIQLQVPAQYP